MRSNIAIFVPHNGCPQQCSFCNQNTISGQSHTPTPNEVYKICTDALATAGTKKLEIAFFGGSFTAIPNDLMLALLQSVQPFLCSENILGVRVSTRPDCIDERVLKLLKDHGVTSIELGAQSMSDEVLTKNQRGHTANDVVKASKLIKEHGFSLGLQMMTGLYGSNPNLDYDTAQAFVDLNPDTVRVYPTVVLAGTDLQRKMQSGDYIAPNVDQTVPLVARIINLFEANNIEIIRLGLHASEQVATEMIGGCYHPAFGELCKSHNYLTQITKRLQALGGSEYILTIHHTKASQVLGQRRSNLQKLTDMGYEINVQVSKTELAGGQHYIIDKA